MLSILIPVYNFDVTALVDDLHHQATECGIDFEIRCYDDGSLEEFRSANRSITALSHIELVELEENVGRSIIRNKLAAEATYENLLFMDCDSHVRNTDFVRQYVEHRKAGTVIYGGRTYAEKPPTDPRCYLRWMYGTAREVTNASERQKKPYRSFMTNNFLIPKSVYQSIKLDETLKGYGHEDTLFGRELRKRQIPIVHIDNPLDHIGLEFSEEFLEKTREGVRNLARLIRQNKVDRDVKLFRYYQMVDRMGMKHTMRNQFKRNWRKIYSNLTSDTPDLRNFDLYKMGCLLEAIAKK